MTERAMPASAGRPTGCGRTHGGDAADRREEPARGRAVAERGRRQGGGALPVGPGPRQRLHGVVAAAARQPDGAGRDPGRVLAGLPDLVAAHDPADAGLRGRAGDRAGQGRPALPARAVVGERGLRLHQAELPAVGALPARHGKGCGGAGRHHPAQARVPYPPAGRCAVAVQLRPHQPRGGGGDHGERRRQSGQGAGEPARRSRARQGRAQGQHDRPQRVRARQEHRHHARQGGLPERADAAHPVHAHDQAGRPAAATDHSALDQQVLHPRPAAQEQLHQVLRRPGQDRLRDLLGQSGRAPS